LDLLNEDAQQRAGGRRIRNITHTNTVTTVYEEGGGRPLTKKTNKIAEKRRREVGSGKGKRYAGQSFNFSIM